MKQKILLTILSLILFFAPKITLADDSLIYQNNLEYLGAFRVPQIGLAQDNNSFNYGGTSLSYNPANNSLYLVGYDPQQYMAEISIPLIINSSNADSLRTATLLQQLKDPTEGRLNSINPSDPNSKKVGGSLVYGGKLYLTGYSYYDGAGTQSTSHFVRPLNLSTTGQVGGPYLVGSNAHFTCGYMTTIPAAWQSQFSGPALTGNCCLSIIGQQSNGPAASVFNPTNIGSINPVSATQVVGYPVDHPLGNSWDQQSIYFNGTTRVRGIVFPIASRSVLFFGHHGTGPFCYGAGTSNQNLDGQPVPGESGVVYCYDPNDNSKGTHAYPYRYQVWAYDANELLQVKSGTKQSWQIQPYSVWNYNLPIGDNDAAGLGGAAYDPATNNVYISQQCVDDHCTPIISVFHINGATGDIMPPSAPGGLSVR